MTNNNTVIAQKLSTPMRYSLGKNKFDNQPEQRTAANFDEFRNVVLKTRSPAKGLKFVCSAFENGNHDTPLEYTGIAPWRLKNLALPCRFLSLDFDGFSCPEKFTATIEYLKRYKGFAYTTASHRNDKPRARAILATDREMTREERIAVGEAQEAEMKKALGEDAIKFDQSVYRSEQPNYTPVTTSKTMRFDGQELEVDALLTMTGSQLDGVKMPTGEMEGNLQKESPPETTEEIERVKQMLDCIPAAEDQGCDRKRYLDVIWAVASTRWSCAEQLARDWCLKSPDEFVEADFVRDWASFNPNKPNAVSVGTLFFLAKQQGYTGESITVDLPEHEWPDPQPIDPPFPAVAPFDAKLLPVSFQAFVDDQSELMQAPPDMIAAPLMVATAAAIGNIIAIAPKARDTSWLVSPVLWGAIVGRTGAMKTPCISAGTKPLDSLEPAMDAAYQAKMQQFQADKLMYAVQQNNAKKAASKGIPFTMPAELVDPQRERLIANDSTWQKLGDLLVNSPRGLLVQRDEIVSLLESLGAEGQEGARGFYLESWNGLNTYRMDRIGRGSFTIPHLFLCVFGGIQPEKLQTYVRQATSGSKGDDGLLQRFQIIVWPDIGKVWKNIDRPPNFAARQTVDAVFVHLRNLDPVAIGAKQGNIGNGPAYLHFTSEAQTLFDQWRGRLEHSLRNGEKHPALESHQSKYKSMIPALALVIHLADRGIGPVTLVALEKAILWGNYLWSHAKRVYASATNSAQASAAELAKRIKSGKLSNGFSARELRRNGWRHLSGAEEVTEALDWLLDAGWLQRQSITTNGRPKDVYTINPKVSSVLTVVGVPTYETNK